MVFRSIRLSYVQKSKQYNEKKKKTTKLRALEQAVETDLLWQYFVVKVYINKTE